jgi:hypothetical protein
MTVITPGNKLLQYDDGDEENGLLHDNHKAAWNTASNG